MIAFALVIERTSHLLCIYFGLEWCELCSSHVPGIRVPIGFSTFAHRVLCVCRPAFGLNCAVNLNCVNSLVPPPPKPSEKFKFICKFLLQFHNSINETITTLHIRPHSLTHTYPPTASTVLFISNGGLECIENFSWFSVCFLSRLWVDNDE